MLYFIDMSRTQHPKTKGEYTFFLRMYKTFFRIDHTHGHKASLNKFKRIEIISSLFSEHNRMKVEINHMKRNEKKMIAWKLNIMSLKTKQLNYDVKEEIKKYLERNENKT